MNELEIFTTGVFSAIGIDLIVQWAFKFFSGKHLKRNYLYNFFWEINLFVPILGGGGYAFIVWFARNN